MTDIVQNTPSTLPARNERRRLSLGSYGVTILSVGAAVAIWAVVSAFSSPFFFPSPLAVGKALVDLTVSGDLPHAVGISYFRILVGWAVGCIVAIPLALKHAGQ